MNRWILAALLVLVLGLVAHAAELVIQLPETVEVIAATASARETGLISTAKIAHRQVVFSGLSEDSIYEVRIKLGDGRVLQGVDLSWHSDEPAPEDAGPLDDDDGKQIQTLVESIRGFENRRDMLRLAGSHDRAVALVQLIRDQPFHGDKAGEVIWRVELWYFMNQHGGWEKVSQQDRVLRRERLKSSTELRQVVDSLVWLPELAMRPAIDAIEISEQQLKR